MLSRENEPVRERHFYLVWSPNGETPPKRQHTSLKAACHAAREMSALFPGTKFYVVKAKYLAVDGATTKIRFLPAEAFRAPDVRLDTLAAQPEAQG